ncbi:hypothetical protein K505DRAFT_229909 [Melanomma pulvis-pyrius CBS 109.77]|uniref:Uncharacterized protein n=1 Tax=Melanomma pulvis-pyrius CBS 109.77 TaxID=1314802 RepID=A0A6A6XU49_9PLEO|nr:hypothetical protein K505DRAFT_229909 [Melanomma pulvis-pyrius CBS 109.77]
MVFKRSLLALFLVCVDKAVYAQSNFSLYAYGKGIEPGLQLFYGDGQAYLGSSAPSFVSQAVNVSSGEDAEFVATPNRTVDGWSAEPTLFIDLTEGANNPIGFVKKNESLGSGSTVSGFGLYGGWAFHKDDGGPIAMKFLASPTNETGIYLVKWNAGATRADDDVPISLRTLAPVPITA